MKPTTAIATISAALLLACVWAGKAYGGWFGLGGSTKSSDATKSPKNDFYDPNLVASGAKTPASASKASPNGPGNLWGLAKPSSTTTTQSSKKKPVTSASKSKPPDKGQDSSWWNSWFKPKQPPPPKSTSEWMKLKPVRY
jgi:hypothetical protein